jgi:hypothetical protein
MRPRQRREGRCRSDIASILTFFLTYPGSQPSSRGYFLEVCQGPLESVKLEAMIRLACEHCHRRLSIADTHAGKAEKCPHCGRPIRIPQAGSAPPGATEHSDKSNAASKWSAEDVAFLDIARLPSGAPVESRPGLPAERGMRTADDVERLSKSEGSAEGAVETPTSFLRALAYPANLDGLVQIVVLVFSLSLAGAFAGLLGALARPYGGLLAIIVQAIVVGYIVYYIGYCIYDSAQGGQHAPTVSPAHLVDLGELISQMVLQAAALAVCFWPAALYRGVAGRADGWFWALGAAGVFFLPMTLLTAVLFDGIDALNPLLILRSILVTLPAYLVLLVKLGVPGGLLAAVYLLVALVPAARVPALALCLYLLLVGAHLLGQFYRRHKDRLGWGL